MNRSGRMNRGSLEGWFSNALMFALKRNGWKPTQRTPWTVDGKWKSPTGGISSWSMLKESAIIIAAVDPRFA